MEPHLIGAKVSPGHTIISNFVACCGMFWKLDDHFDLMSFLFNSPQFGIQILSF